MFAAIAEQLFPSFSCETCKEHQKAERGCFGHKAPFPYWADVDGEQHSTCPRRPLMHDRAWFNSLLLYYGQYSKGFYPEPGGINDQPAKFPELMVTIEHILNVVGEERRKKFPPKKPTNTRS